ncbi:hypothetical protein BDD12DRAFT_870214 [Trichophaea hybrida]|nr:hypothetical protein BDD12DRAFT_870214 [Trichophaea hybrida]
MRFCSSSFLIFAISNLASAISTFFPIICSRSIPFSRRSSSISRRSCCSPPPLTPPSTSPPPSSPPFALPFNPSFNLISRSVWVSERSSL